MKPIDKVTSQPLSKRMKELGWDYETERCWLDVGDEKYNNSCWSISRVSEAKQFHWAKTYPAPDAIEIGEKLPDIINQYEEIEQYKNAIGEVVLYLKSEDHFRAVGSTEAEARGKMWCYLKERGLI